MHWHIAVAALPGVVRAVHKVQHVGVKQRQCQRRHRQYAGPDRPAVRILAQTAQPRATAQQKSTDGPSDSRCQKDGGQGKAQRERKHRGQDCQQGNAKPAPQREQHSPLRVRYGPLRQQKPHRQKEQQIRKRQKHHTPSKSNGGVYSSRALLFSCI